MDIPKKHLQGLAFLADDSDAGDQFLQKYNPSQSSSPSLAAFRAFVQKVFQSSISQAHKHTFSSGGSSNSSNNNDNDNDNGSDGNGDACEKMCVASLLCLILEASKQDAVTEEIRYAALRCADRRTHRRIHRRAHMYFKCSYETLRAYQYSRTYSDILLWETPMYVCILHPRVHSHGRIHIVVCVCTYWIPINSVHP